MEILPVFMSGIADCLNGRMMLFSYQGAISKILTIFILQNGFPLKWFLDILNIRMQICLTTDVAQTEKRQIRFCFP